MKKAVPSKKQLEWADMELGVIIHYLADIYNPDFEDYKTEAVRTELSPDIMNPTRLSPEQWVRSAYEMGAKYAVFVANHCTGFSMWQTKVNDYSCASLKWKNGKGDVFREFLDACKKYGIKPGVYYSTGCNGYYNINDEWDWDYKSDYYQEYVKNVERQVTELWSEYGEMFEIWFDGGIVPAEQGGPDILPLLKKYQPDAVTFQGPTGYPNNLRWVGNEDGYAPETCWSAWNGEGDSRTGSPDGIYWEPAETDFPNRTHEAHGGGWGWRENEKQYCLTPEQLLDCYVKSVGRNTNMLLGMGISVEGDFEDEDQFIEFGKLLKKTFGTPKAEIKDTKEKRFTFNVKGLDAKYLSVCEDITNGQNIKAFSVYADGEKIYGGQCVGHKRIIPIDGAGIGEISFTVDEADENMKIKSIQIF